jgi:hypothetical protein
VVRRVKDGLDALRSSYAASATAQPSSSSAAAAAVEASVLGSDLRILPSRNGVTTAVADFSASPPFVEFLAAHVAEDGSLRLPPPAGFSVTIVFAGTTSRRFRLIKPPPAWVLDPSLARATLETLGLTVVAVSRLVTNMGVVDHGALEVTLKLAEHERPPRDLLLEADDGAGLSVAMRLDPITHTIQSLPRPPAASQPQAGDGRQPGSYAAAVAAAVGTRPAGPGMAAAPAAATPQPGTAAAGDPLLAAAAPRLERSPSAPAGAATAAGDALRPAGETAPPAASAAAPLPAAVGTGALPPPAPAPLSPLQTLIARCKQHLAAEGLVPPELLERLCEIGADDEELCFREVLRPALVHKLRAILGPDATSLAHHLADSMRASSFLPELCDAAAPASPACQHLVDRHLLEFARNQVPLAVKAARAAWQQPDLSIDDPVSARLDAGVVLNDLRDQGHWLATLFAGCYGYHDHHEPQFADGDLDLLKHAATAEVAGTPWPPGLATYHPATKQWVHPKPIRVLHKAATSPTADVSLNTDGDEDMPAAPLSGTKRPAVDAAPVGGSGSAGDQESPRRPAGKGGKRPGGGRAGGRDGVAADAATPSSP